MGWKLDIQDRVEPVRLIAVSVEVDVWKDVAQAVRHPCLHGANVLLMAREVLVGQVHCRRESHDACGVFRPPTEGTLLATALDLASNLHILVHIQKANAFRAMEFVCGTRDEMNRQS